MATRSRPLRENDDDEEENGGEGWKEGFKLMLLCFTPSDDVIDFIIPSLPLMINTLIAFWTTSRMQKPTREVSFWRLFWIPYHPDMPLQTATSIMIASAVQAVLSILRRRFPRALQAYARDGTTRLPLKAHKLLPRYNSPTVNVIVMAVFVGIVLNRLVGSGVLQPVIGLLFYTLMACCALFPVLIALSALWSIVRSHPQRPPLGVVTGVQ